MGKVLSFKTQMKFNTQKRLNPPLKKVCKLCLKLVPNIKPLFHKKCSAVNLHKHEKISRYNLMYLKSFDCFTVYRYPNHTNLINCSYIFGSVTIQL